MDGRVRHELPQCRLGARLGVGRLAGQPCHHKHPAHQPRLPAVGRDAPYLRQVSLSGLASLQPAYGVQQAGIAALHADLHGNTAGGSHQPQQIAVEVFRP